MDVAHASRILTDNAVLSMLKELVRADSDMCRLTALLGADDIVYLGNPLLAESENSDKYEFDNPMDCTIPEEGIKNILEDNHIKDTFIASQRVLESCTDGMEYCKEGVNMFAMMSVERSPYDHRNYIGLDKEATDLMIDCASRYANLFNCIDYQMLNILRQINNSSVVVKGNYSTDDPHSLELLFLEQKKGFFEPRSVALYGFAEAFGTYSGDEELKRIADEVYSRSHAILDLDDSRLVFMET